MTNISTVSDIEKWISNLEADSVYVFTGVELQLALQKIVELEKQLVIVKVTTEKIALQEAMNHADYLADKAKQSIGKAKRSNKI